MPVFMKLRDVDLFLRSARTDARIKRLQPRVGAAAALEAVYAANPVLGRQPRHATATRAANTTSWVLCCRPDASGAPLTSAVASV